MLEQRQFFKHYDPVKRKSDGNFGMVKDIEGEFVNIIWNDGSKSWHHIDELEFGVR